jgi:hypothetical protein
MPRSLVFDGYEDRFPSHQNAVDLLKGWNTSFPKPFGLKAGEMPLYSDHRVTWALEQFGDLHGRRILELGPLDGGHTSTLAKTGAAIDAIEANKTAFLRSLVAREVYGHANVRLFLGDFVKWLENSNENYDLVFACGVLYHMNDPLRFLRAIAKRTEFVYLWTVCVTNDLRQVSRMGDLGGRPIRLYKESYHGANANDDYCGGMLEEHYWLHRDDIIGGLQAIGFTHINVAPAEVNKFGPVIGLMASKSPTLK